MDNVKQIIAHRIPHYKEDFPLILFWSEKSGCTSLVKWFFFQIGILDTALRYHKWVHNYEFEVYKKAPTYQLDLILSLIKSEKDVYKLVRNPYKRAVSSFVMLNFDTMPNHPIWPDFLSSMREYFYNNKNSNEGVSFKQYLQFLKIKGSDVYSVDGHFAQQYVEGEEKYISKYLYLEDYNDSIRQIERRYGLNPTPLEMISDSGHHFSSNMIHKGNFADVRTTDPSFPHLPTFESFYDDETKALVEEVYKKDFEHYMYKKEL